MAVFKYNLNVEGKDYSLAVDDGDDKSWYIIKEESYRPDKDKFVLDKFNEKYPKMKQTKIQTVYNLCSRSSTLNVWLAGINLEYAKSSQVPTFYRDLVEPDVFKETQEELTKINKLESDKAAIELELAKSYKAELKRVVSEYENKVNQIIKTKTIRVLNLKSTDLPIYIQLAIENYTPGKATDSPDKKTFGRELLINYKKMLLQILSKNKDVDIQKIIDDAREK